MAGVDMITWKPFLDKPVFTGRRSSLDSHMQASAALIGQQDETHFTSPCTRTTATASNGGHARLFCMLLRLNSRTAGRVPQLP